jgi:tripartite-type tricarboxylate transporter receptor subunit TctC
VPELPDVPTLAEAGIKDVELPAWSGLYGPPGMPAAMTSAIHAEVVAASRQPDYVKLVKMAGDISNLPPQQFAALNAEELQRYRRDLLPLGIRID